MMLTNCSAFWKLSSVISFQSGGEKKEDRRIKYQLFYCYLTTDLVITRLFSIGLLAESMVKWYCSKNLPTIRGKGSCVLTSRIMFFWQIGNTNKHFEYGGPLQLHHDDSSKSGTLLCNGHWCCKPSVLSGFMVWTKHPRFFFSWTQSVEVAVSFCIVWASRHRNNNVRW